MRPSVNLLRLSSRPSSLPSRLLSTHTSPPPSAPTSRRYLATTALLTAGVSAGLVLSLYLPRPQLLQLLYPLPTPTPHAADSPQAREESARLEKELQALPQVAKLRAERVAAHSMGEGATSPAGSSLEQAASTKTETIAKWTEHRPYAATPPGPHSLSGYALRGPGKFAIPPLVFASRDKKEQIFFMHLGGGLCGHEGIIHGGLLGTVLDESLGRTALLALPTNIGVTATLSLAYKKPTFANQFVCIRTSLEKVSGRKAWVKGRVESLEGEVLVEAEALFVEPKMAKFLDNSSVKAALA